MRPSVADEVCVHADAAERLVDSARRLGLVDAGDRQSLAYDVADLAAWVQRGGRVLKDDLQVRSQCSY